MTSDRFLIRRVNEYNKERILNLCDLIVDSSISDRKTAAELKKHEYVKCNLDSWIKKTELNIPLMAVHANSGKVVGFVNLSFLGKDEAMLEGGRTHPQFQRRGILTYLLKHSTRIALRNRQRLLVRAFSDTSNTANIKAIAKLEMKLTTVYHLYVGEIRRKRLKKEIRILGTDDLQNVWNYIADSDFVKHSSGTFPHNSYFKTLRKEDVISYLRDNRGLAWINKKINGLMLFQEKNDNSIQVCLLIAEQSNIAKDLIESLGSFSPYQKYKLIVFSPNEPKLRNALQSSDFTESNEVGLLFERVYSSNH